MDKYSLWWSHLVYHVRYDFGETVETCLLNIYINMTNKYDKYLALSNIITRVSFEAGCRRFSPASSAPIASYSKKKKN